MNEEINQHINISTLSYSCELKQLRQLKTNLVNHIIVVIGKPHHCSNDVIPRGDRFQLEVDPCVPGLHISL